MPCHTLTSMISDAQWSVYSATTTMTCMLSLETSKETWQSGPKVRQPLFAKTHRSKYCKFQIRFIGPIQLGPYTLMGGWTISSSPSSHHRSSGSKRKTAIQSRYTSQIAPGAMQERPKIFFA